MRPIILSDSWRHKMLNKTLILFSAIILGTLAFPTPEEDDMSIFFENVNSNSRIVGGTEAAEGSHPHMAAITSGLIVKSFMCGASIISPRSAMTAAHCAVPLVSGESIKRSAKINIGSNNWKGGVEINIIGSATHADYNPNTIKNDIGMLFTEVAITYTDLIKPIAISYEPVEGGVPVIAAGWGRVSTNGRVPNLLRELTVPTLGRQECQEEMVRSAAQLNFRPPPIDTEIELCTLHDNGAGFGMCRGDSGSALSRVDTGEQVALVSWGLPCALGAPDMFVRLSAYKDWIEEHVKY
ncbi:hypothetical protein ACJJTC_006305 [Scirpophaga incertulas]